MREIPKVSVFANRLGNIRKSTAKIARIVTNMFPPKKYDIKKKKEGRMKIEMKMRKIIKIIKSKYEIDKWKKWNKLNSFTNVTLLYRNHNFNYSN